ncbi:MAG: hypothetical protein MMC23_005186 [Stictis urceolatum]|nr:hypothetical protein [Stictis urceolata]
MFLLSSLLSLLLLTSPTAATTATPPPTPSTPNAAFITPSPALPPAFPLELFRRQNACPAAHSACTQYNRAGICCATSAYCTTDSGNHIACCPSGASCTGNIGSFSSGGTQTQTGGAAGGAGGQNQGTGGSTVSNSFFPWVYIPATFSDKGECEGYVTSCADEYASCTSSLVGGGNGGQVTITGPGVTRGGQALGQASAAGVCASLSSVGCRGLRPSSCSSLPSGSAAGTTGGGAAGTGGVVLTAAGGVGRVGGSGWRMGVVFGMIAALQA